MYSRKFQLDMSMEDFQERIQIAGRLYLVAHVGVGRCDKAGKVLER